MREKHASGPTAMGAGASGLRRASEGGSSRVDRRCPREGTQKRVHVHTRSRWRSVQGSVRAPGPDRRAVADRQGPACGCSCVGTSASGSAYSSASAAAITSESGFYSEAITSRRPERILRIHSRWPIL